MNVQFRSLFKQFWITENTKSILEKTKMSNDKTNAKAISMFDFYTLYTKLSHFDLINVLRDSLNSLNLHLRGGNYRPLLSP